MPSGGSNFDWGTFLLTLVDQFVVTPKERMEHEAQLARVRAEEAMAAAQLAAAGRQAAMLNTVLVGAALLGVGVLAFSAMK